MQCRWPAGSKQAGLNHYHFVSKCTSRRTIQPCRTKFPISCVVENVQPGETCRSTLVDRLSKIRMIRSTNAAHHVAWAGSFMGKRARLTAGALLLTRCVHHVLQRAKSDPLQSYLYSACWFGAGFID